MERIAGRGVAMGEGAARAEARKAVAVAERRSA
jgi:hypothetical protein